MIRARFGLRRVFQGWRIVAGGMGLQALLAALFFQIYGAYAPLWIAEFGWSRTTIALVFSLNRIESGLMGPLQGWILERISPRLVVLIGVLVWGFGFLALTQVQTLLQFILVFSIMAVGATLCGALTLMTVIVNWFQSRRARALSMMHLGFSIGGLTVPLVAHGLVAYGWRPIALVSGVLVLLTGIPIARLMHRAPEPLGLRPDGTSQRKRPYEPAPATSTPAPTLEASLAIRTPAFWLMTGGHAAGLAVTSAFFVHFVIYANEHLGMRIADAATLMALLTLTSVLGQLLGGAFGDRFDKRWISGGAMLGHVAAMAILVVAATPQMAGLATVLQGLSMGIKGPMMGALRADHFGRKTFATVSGFASMISMGGAVGGPLLVGFIADTAGGYPPAFALLAAIASGGAVAFLTLDRPPSGNHDT